MSKGPDRVAAATEIADAPEPIRVRIAFGWSPYFRGLPRGRWYRNYGGGETEPMTDDEERWFRHG